MLKLTIDDNRNINVCRITDSNWHHVVINSDGFRNVDVYIDNDKVLTGAKPISSYKIDRASSDMKVLTAGNISISDFRLYGRYLTEEECLRLYGIAPEDYDITN